MPSCRGDDAHCSSHRLAGHRPRWKIPRGGAASGGESISSCAIGEGSASDGEGMAGAIALWFRAVALASTRRRRRS